MTSERENYAKKVDNDFYYRKLFGAIMSIKYALNKNKNDEIRHTDVVEDEKSLTLLTKRQLHMNIDHTQEELLGPCKREPV